MRMTLPCHTAGTETSYRVLSKPGQEFHMVNGAVHGEPIDRLGLYEDLNYEPEELKEIIKRYNKYKHLFAK